MNGKTLKALDGSIKKWNDIVNNDGEDDGITNCPLCKVFKSDECTNCPVREKTKQSGCMGSPYSEFYDHHTTQHIKYPRRIECKTCKTLAKKELAFLKSLKPKRRKK